MNRSPIFASLRRRKRPVVWVQLLTLLVWSVAPPIGWAGYWQYNAGNNASGMPIGSNPSWGDLAAVMQMNNGFGPSNVSTTWYTDDPENDPEPAGGLDSTDVDQDNLPAWFEDWFGTLSGDPDTDDDGALDGDELATMRTDPRNADTDGDGTDDKTQWLDAQDPDSDGLTTGLERLTHSTQPNNPDTDGDGLLDGQEVNGFLIDPVTNDPITTNPAVADTDTDGIHDYEDYLLEFFSEADFDSDTLSNTSEYVATPRTKMRVADTDGDGLWDGVEVNTTYPVPTPGSKTDPTLADTDSDTKNDSEDPSPTVWSQYNQNLLDNDQDGLSNALETTLTTDPNDEDTDDDGLLDGAEHTTTYQPGNLKTNPKQADTDGDGLTDGVEATVIHPETNSKTNPTRADTDADTKNDSEDPYPTVWTQYDPNLIDDDNDGASLAREAIIGTDPEDDDSDDDGLKDGYEDVTIYNAAGQKTSPLNPDTDNDGLSDGYEVTFTESGFSPVDSDSDDDMLDDGEEYLVAQEPSEDFDSDGVTNAAEIALGTRVRLADTDQDGLGDGFERDTGYGSDPSFYTFTNPLDSDSDDDGVIDGSDPNPTTWEPAWPLRDDDSDGILNGNEAAFGTNTNNADTDGDGLEDGYEVNTIYPVPTANSKTSPTDDDTDNDTQLDGTDPQPTVWNDPNAWRYLDGDGDGLNAGIESDYNGSLGLTDVSADSDGDGLEDWYEHYFGSGLHNADVLNDTDGDGLGPVLEQRLQTVEGQLDTNGDFKPDWWEFYQNALYQTDSVDEDGDGLNAVLEGLIGTSDSAENNAGIDSDADGLSDSYEWAYSYYSSATDNDTDDDGLSDGAEQAANTFARERDSDDDYLTDAEEVNDAFGSDFNPRSPDSDGDGVPDFAEADLTDTDQAGIPDRLEEHWGLNKLDPLDERGDVDSDGWWNVLEYDQGYDIFSQYDSQFDQDHDGISDIMEIAMGLNPEDQHDGADDPDGDYLTNKEEVAHHVRHLLFLSPGHAQQEVQDRDDSSGELMFFGNGIPLMRAVANDFEVAFGNELRTSILMRNNGYSSEDEWEDDWDNDGRTTYQELYPETGNPTDPRNWDAPPPPPCSCQWTTSTPSQCSCADANGCSSGSCHVPPASCSCSNSNCPGGTSCGNASSWMTYGTCGCAYTPPPPPPYCSCSNAYCPGGTNCTQASNWANGNGCSCSYSDPGGGNPPPPPPSCSGCSSTTCPGQDCGCGGTGGCGQQTNQNCICGGSLCGCASSSDCDGPGSIDCFPEPPGTVSGSEGGGQYFLVCIPTQFGNDPFEPFPLSPDSLIELGKKYLVNILEEETGQPIGSIAQIMASIATADLFGTFTARILGVYRTGPDKPWQYYESPVDGNGLGTSSDIYRATSQEDLGKFYGDRDKAEQDAVKFIEHKIEND